MHRSNPNWECSAPRSRIRGRFRRLAFALVAAAFAMLAAVPASAQSIIDLVAPGAAAFPPNFAFPFPACKDKCGKLLTDLNGLRDQLAKDYDTQEWKDWWNANEELKTATTALKDAEAAAKAGQPALDQAKKDLGKAKGEQTQANKDLDKAKGKQTQANKDLAKANAAGKAPGIAAAQKR